MNGDVPHIYRIKDWSSHYENNRTRELKRLDWVPIPNRMDGVGYTDLLDHPNGAAHFGAWIAIVEIASRCEIRGTLSHEGAGLQARDLARISRMPRAVFEEVIPRLQAIGWIEVIGCNKEIPQDAAVIPQLDAVIPQDVAPRVRAGALPFPSIPFPSVPSDFSERGLGKTLFTGQKSNGASNGSDVTRFEELWNLWPRKNDKDSAMRDYLLFVHGEVEEKVIQCAQRYLASQEVSEGKVRYLGTRVSHGSISTGWIADCARDNWDCDWPAARAPVKQSQSFKDRDQEAAMAQLRKLKGNMK